MAQPGLNGLDVVGLSRVAVAPSPPPIPGSPLAGCFAPTPPALPPGPPPNPARCATAAIQSLRSPSTAPAPSDAAAPQAQAACLQLHLPLDGISLTPRVGEKATDASVEADPFALGHAPSPSVTRGHRSGPASAARSPARKTSGATQQVQGTGAARKSYRKAPKGMTAGRFRR